MYLIICISEISQSDLIFKFELFSYQAKNNYFRMVTQSYLNPFLIKNTNPYSHSCGALKSGPRLWKLIHWRKLLLPYFWLKKKGKIVRRLPWEFWKTAKSGRVKGYSSDLMAQWLLFKHHATVGTFPQCALFRLMKSNWYHITGFLTCLKKKKNGNCVILF